MFNGYAFAGGLFEHQINGYRGMVVTRVIHDIYELDPKLGIAGGGGFDFRFDWGPIGFALDGLPRDAPKWGPEYKRMLREYYTRSVYVLAHATQLPSTNSISLDPGDGCVGPARDPDDLRGASQRPRLYRVSAGPRPRAAGRGRREPSLGLSARARLSRKFTCSAPAAWGTTRSLRWSIAITAPTTCPTCSSWMAAAW